MRLVDTAEHRKARGAFFTPPELADFLVRWGVRNMDDRVLEPSCGEAAFLVPALNRLFALGANAVSHEQLQGVELHEASAAEARELVRAAGGEAFVATGDFFDQELLGYFDAIVGNPPYVRYQDFNGESRLRSRKAALAQGVRLTGLASSWAAFVVHASSYLVPDGRLGLVLPAELMTTNYASDVRRFLMDRFKRVRLIVFDQRVFPDVQEEVVLLMAEGSGPTDHFELYQARDASDLASLDSTAWRRAPGHAAGKWTPALLPRTTLAIFNEITNGSEFGPLEGWGQTSLGMVTGNNRYFTLSTQRAAELRLRTKELLPISPPGSRHLRGMTFTSKAWDELAVAGKNVYLFYPDRDKPSAAAKRYIALGEGEGVQDAYKCRVREPWWSVPLVDAPDLLLTYMNQDAPRLSANRASVRYLNSVHGLKLKSGLRRLGQDLLPLATLNSLTLLGAETVGRAYGGGLLKLEPNEADVLPVPSANIVRRAAGALRALRPQLGHHLRHGNLLAAAKLVDDVLLVREMKLRRKEVEELREGRAFLFARRESRAGR